MKRNVSERVIKSERERLVGCRVWRSPQNRKVLLHPTPVSGKHKISLDKSLNTTPPNCRAMAVYSNEEKGNPVRIVGGKYIGREGWRRAGKANTRHYAYVILRLEDGEEKEFRIRKGNVGRPFTPPRDYVDAVLQQHEEIDHALVKLCKLLAKCDLTGAETELQRAFLQQMQAAHAQQLSEGGKALWFRVDFQGPAGK